MTSKWSQLVLNWFPGHMSKGFRNMNEVVQKCDIIVEVRDARIPFSSANPNLHNMIKGSKKRHIILLNKSDLASESELNKWVDQLNKSKIVMPITLINEKKQKNWTEQQRGQFKRLLTLMSESDQKAQGKKRFAMVVGFPNVGKSTLINQLIGRKKTSVASKPAWTRNLSFYQIDFDRSNKNKNKTIGQRLGDTLSGETLKTNEYWVVDTPGIMLPEKLEPERGLKLALCQILDDNVVPDSYITMAEYLHYILCQKEDKTWKQMIGYENEEDSFEKLLEHIKLKYGKKTEDEQSRFFVSIFRKGGIGKYNLDDFEDTNELL